MASVEDPAKKLDVEGEVWEAHWAWKAARPLADRAQRRRPLALPEHHRWSRHSL